MDIIVNVSQVAIINLLSENNSLSKTKKFKKAPHLSTLESNEIWLSIANIYRPLSMAGVQLSDTSLMLSNQQQTLVLNTNDIYYFSWICEVMSNSAELGQA